MTGSRMGMTNDGTGEAVMVALTDALGFRRDAARAMPSGLRHVVAAVAGLHGVAGEAQQTMVGANETRQSADSLSHMAENLRVLVSHFQY